MSRRFTTESLFEISQVLKQSLREGPVTIEVVNPDLEDALYPGERFELDGQAVVYRPFQTWCELAEGLMAVLQTPVAISSEWVRLSFRPLSSEKAWTNTALSSGETEKYGVGTAYARTSKLETPSFLVSYLEALDVVGASDRPRVLSLGVNRGDELGLLAQYLEASKDSERLLVGVDHSSSAIQQARQRYPEAMFHFVEGDVQRLDEYELGTFDLLISINTLHSPALDGHRLFQQLIQHHLRPNGAVILGVPNSRYVDHTLLYGAKMKNFSTPDLSILWKNVSFYRRYLHQHGFQVRILGKHTVLVVGRKKP